MLDRGGPASRHHEEQDGEDDEAEDVEEDVNSAWDARMGCLLQRVSNLCAPSGGNVAWPGPLVRGLLS